MAQILLEMAPEWCQNGAMNLTPYVEGIQRQLEDAAETGTDETRAIAERLIGPLEAAMRLALQDVLSAAMDEVTTEIAPGSVELRLRGRDIELIVALPPDSPDRDLVSDFGGEVSNHWATSLEPNLVDGDDAAVARINLRLPDHLKARIERAASGESLSINSWLVRAAGAALDQQGRNQQVQQVPHGAQRFKGWAR